MFLTDIHPRSSMFFYYSMVAPLAGDESMKEQPHVAPLDGEIALRVLI